jgi:cellulose biosynthesis protein BcsQ
MSKRKREGNSPRTIRWPDTEEKPWEAPLIVGIYNYKGGVGKSTLTLNLAAEYSRYFDAGGKIGGRNNVLVVDCDPQCNTSSFLLDASSSFDPPNSPGMTAAATGDIDGSDDGSEWGKGSDDDSVFGGHNDDPQATPDLAVNVVTPGQAAELLQKASAGLTSPNGQQLYARQPKLTESNAAHGSPVVGALGEYDDNVVDLLRDVFDDNIGNFYRYMDTDLTTSSKSSEESQPRALCDAGKTAGVRFVIPGSPRIVEWDAVLSDAYGTAERFKRTCGVFACFRYALMATANAVGAGIIIVDMGPSAGMLNQMVAMSCDVLIPPVFPDRFSRSSIEGLLKFVLSHWYSRHMGLVSRYKRMFTHEMKEKEGEHYCLRDEYDGELTPFVMPFKMRPPLLSPTLVSRLHGEGTSVRRLGALTSSWIHAMQDEFGKFAEPHLGDDRESRRSAASILVGRFAAAPAQMVIPFTHDEPKLFEKSQSDRIAMVETDVPSEDGFFQNRLAIFRARHSHLRVWIESLRTVVNAEKAFDAREERKRIAENVALYKGSNPNGHGG